MRGKNGRGPPAERRRRIPAVAGLAGRTEGRRGSRSAVAPGTQKRPQGLRGTAVPKFARFFFSARALFRCGAPERGRPVNSETAGTRTWRPTYLPFFFLLHAVQSPVQPQQPPPRLRSSARRARKASAARRRSSRISSPVTAAGLRSDRRERRPARR